MSDVEALMTGAKEPPKQKKAPFSDVFPLFVSEAIHRLQTFWIRLWSQIIGSRSGGAGTS